MIKSTKLTIKYANALKRENISCIIDEYRDVTQQLVDMLWDCPEIPRYLNAKFTNNTVTSLSARLVQAAGKQASGIVRGARRKQKKYEFVINKLNKEGNFKQARQLQRKLDTILASKPDIKTVEMQLDGRFAKIEWGNETSFDGWLTLTSLGLGRNFQIPLKKHKHLLKLMREGVMLKGIRVSKKMVCLSFDIPTPEVKEEGNTIGIDIGINSVLSCSNGYQSPKQDIHGWTLQKIVDKMGKKRYGSHEFYKAKAHQGNFVNWSINRLNLQGINRINIEDLTNMKKGKRFGKQTKHWSYPNLFDKLVNFCETSGVHVERKKPAYTSQRCSVCGWTQKRNRSGEKFKCAKCGFATNADLNASVNLSLSLPTFAKQKDWSKQNNRTGFYWAVLNREPIVPGVQKTEGVA